VQREVKREVKKAAQLCSLTVDLRDDRSIQESNTRYSRPCGCDV